MGHVFTIRTLLCAAAFLPVGSSAYGAVLASYNLTNGSTASTDADAGSDAGGFSFTGAGGGISVGTGTAFLRSSATGADAAAAASDTDFFSFTVTAGSGQQLNLSSLTLDVGASNNTLNGGSVSFTNTLYVSANGSSIGTAGHTVGDTNGSNNFASPGASFDLSGSQYQALTSITFRLAFSDDADVEQAINRLDNIVLNGTTSPVPEPTLFALAPLGLIAMVRRRR